MLFIRTTNLPVGKYVKYIERRSIILINAPTSGLLTSTIKYRLSGKSFFILHSIHAPRNAEQDDDCKADQFVTVAIE